MAQTRGARERVASSPSGVSFPCLFTRIAHAIRQDSRQIPFPLVMPEAITFISFHPHEVASLTHFIEGTSFAQGHTVSLRGGATCVSV